MADNLRERYIATLVGCGIGDSLGMPVEGWKKEQIQRYIGKITEPIEPVIIKNKKNKIISRDKFGKLPCYTRDLKKGEYTDDTILTLAIAEAIAEKRCLDFAYITQKQIEAYMSCKMANGHVRGGFGSSTKEAFERIISGMPRLWAGSEPGLGTGPCMKMSPVGLYMSTKKDYDEASFVARKIGLSTHKDERAIAAGIVQAEAICGLLQGLSKEDFLDCVVQSCQVNEKPFNRKYLPEKGTLTERVRWVKENRRLDEKLVHEYLGSGGLALESYPFTIFMYQKYWDEPVKGLIEIVNWGGDCDTTGAMYGALAGAKNGMIFPTEWVKVLKNKERLHKAGEGIYALAKNGR